MPTVVVRVNDRPYNMVCDEGEEEHLAELASLLENEVTKLKKTFGQVGDSRLLLMAGLVVADKLDETVRRIEALEGEIEGLKDARTAAVERSRMLETTVAERLAKTAERLERFTAELTSRTD